MLISRIHENGRELLASLGITTIHTLTHKQITLILSLQDGLKKTESGRWKVQRQVGDILVSKKRQGGYFRLEDWKTKVFLG